MTPWTVHAIAAAVNGGSATAREIADISIEAIAQRNPALNAIIDHEPAACLIQADAVDRRIAAGEVLPLAGVPVAVKDNIWVAGQRVTQGSLLFAGFQPPADAIAVERLRNAGAVIVGMSNTSEFACKGVTTNRLHGATRHPMDPALTPGGSSGGPVVAVAAGMVPLALGTDSGGSSRRPPAHVGVVGFKPTFGAVPYGPGFAEPVPGIGVICPITRTVDDVALVFEILAGFDPRDPDTSAPLMPAEFRPLRIAYSPRFGLDTPVDDDVAEAVESAVALLGEAGVTVVRRDPVWPDGVTESSLMPLQHAGLAAIHGEAFRRDPGLFDPDIAVQIESGLSLTGAEVSAALLLSAELARRAGQPFADADLLVGPTVPCVAWPLDRLGPETIGGVPVAPRAHAVFTPLFNHAKVPAISIPCGRGRAGLPVGIQIVGPRGHDRRVLAFAAFAETVLAYA
jgi:aspartyl-tRNA(Asn)/glutamyl-tRNA(Gln) amidotransferase subunit A